MRAFFLILLVFSITCASAQASYLDFECRKDLSSARASALFAAVEKRYEAISDLQAGFRQESFFVGLGQRKQSSGEVYYKKPGMMDWRYSEPEEQRFVADGKTLWFFQPGLNQVTIGEFKQSFHSDLPVSFLLGIGKIREKFKLESACATTADVSLKLSPLTEDESLQEFFLLVSEKTNEPVGARIVDIGGNETVIILDHLLTNSKLASSRFSFEIPRGVDIIDRREQEADIPAAVIK